MDETLTNIKKEKAFKIFRILSLSLILLTFIMFVLHSDKYATLQIAYNSYLYGANIYQSNISYILSSMIFYIPIFIFSLIAIIFKKKRKLFFDIIIIIGFLFYSYCLLQNIVSINSYLQYRSCTSNSDTIENLEINILNQNISALKNMIIVLSLILTFIFNKIKCLSKFTIIIISLMILASVTCFILRWNLVDYKILDNYAESEPLLNLQVFIEYQNISLLLFNSINSIIFYLYIASDTLFKKIEEQLI